MNASKYLNVILTINAGLLTGLLWTQLAPSPLLDQTAIAQSVSSSSTPPPSTSEGCGIPNAGAQRLKIIEGLREVKASVDATRALLEGGTVRIEVTNFDDLKPRD